MEAIESIDDPRMGVFANLKDRQLKRDGLFITEGRILTARLLRSEFDAEAVLVAPQHADQLEQLCAGRCSLYVACPEIISQIVGFDFHRGVLGCGRRSRPRTAAGVLESLGDKTPQTLIVCPEINNTENLGSILRTAGAFGIDAVLLGERCCDPFCRRCVRVSMGGGLFLPIVESEDLLADLKMLKATGGFELVATVLDDESESLGDFQASAKTCLLFGNEGDGLQRRWLDVADRKATIEMAPGSDSLNLAVAVGIFVYETMTGRREE